MKFILGKKIGMLQFFDGESLKAIPVTLVEAEPNTVVQVRTKAKDGYAAIQLGTGVGKKLNKPQAGHLKELGRLKNLREFRLGEKELLEYKPGDKIKVDIFVPGDKVAVSGISKGKGFAGVVKRHGFAGGPKTHGQKHSLRRPGSIGATTPQRVIKGTRMAGHMGDIRVTQRGLRILAVNPEKNILLIKGALPGGHGCLLEIKTRA